MTPETVSACYARLSTKRLEPLERARTAAGYTIPSLAPPDGHNETSATGETWQAVGARGVNNIASRVLLTLFPPNTANWRGYVPVNIANREGIDANALAEIDAALSQYEQEFRRSFEASGDRASLYEALRYYVVTGNAGCRFLPEGRFRHYTLAQYVVTRDLDGNLLKGIVKETIAYKALSEKIRNAITEKDPSGQERDQVHVYTLIERTKGTRWRECQYIDDKEVDGSEATYPNEDRLPWRFLRHSAIPGEDYGRGIVEDHGADLRSLDSLMQSIVQGIAVAVKIILFVRPGSTVSKKNLEKARNGDVITGHADDVSILRIEKATDLRVALEMTDRLEQRLSFAFLLNSAVQRNAERVTAEEIKFMAQELEAALGGFYSRLTVDLQVWYVRQRMAVCAKSGELPSLPKGVKVQVIGGIDALGRSAELDALDRLLQGAMQTLGPDVVQKIINIDDYIRRRAAALGIDARSLVKSKDQQAQEASQAQQNTLANTAAPNLITQAGAAFQAAQQPAAAQPTPQGQ